VDAQPGLPDPFFDTDGFPLCLYRIRDEVTPRGGRITGSGFDWKLVPPTAAWPAVQVTFGSDGDVNIQVTPAELIIIDAGFAYTPMPGHDLSDLDYALDGILAGNYAQFSATTNDGTQTAHGWQLRTATNTLGNTAYDIPVPADQPADTARSWHYSWTTYPAWPSA
jgi:hypothetical protein